MKKRRRRARSRNGISDYSVVFAQCRDWGHDWNDPVRWARGERDFLCGRCGTGKTEKYNRGTMKKAGAKYHYPEGYRTTAITQVEAAVECRRLLERLVAAKGLGFLRHEHAAAIRKGV